MKLIHIYLGKYSRKIYELPVEQWIIRHYYINTKQKKKTTKIGCIVRGHFTSIFISYIIEERKRKKSMFNYLKRVGQLIKHYRKEQKLSYRQLSQKVYVSKTVIAEMEKGLSNASEELYSLIFEYFDIDIKKNIEISNQMIDKNADYRIAVYTMNMNEAEQLYQEIMKYNHEEMKTLLAYPEYLLIQFVHHVLQSEIESADQLEKEIEPFESIFEPHILQYYTFYKIMKNENRIKFYDSYTQYISCLSISGDSHNLGLINNQLGILTNRMGQSIISLKYCEQANRYYTSVNNIRRSMAVSMHIANIYLGSDLYLLAEKTYFNLLDTAKAFGFTTIIAKIASNLVWLYLLWEKYDLVNKYVELAFKYNTVAYSLYFENAYAYYKLDLIESSLMWIEKGKSKLSKINTHTFRKDVNLYELNYLEAMIHHRYEEAEQQLLGYLDFIQNRFDSQSEIFFLKELVSLYETMGNTEKVNKTLKIIVDKYSHNDSHLLDIC